MIRKDNDIRSFFKTTPIIRKPLEETNYTKPKIINMENENTLNKDDIVTFEKAKDSKVYVTEKKQQKKRKSEFK